ncbi:hypothetical protein JK169_09045 [Acetobacter persici]|nr:hypothetical protein [Acetobacter persici]
MDAWKAYYNTVRPHASLDNVMSEASHSSMPPRHTTPHRT